METGIRQPRLTPEELFDIAASPEAAPEPGAVGSAIVCSTPAAIERFRQITLLHGLYLESKGIKVRNGATCLTIARQYYGIKARTKVAAHAELLKILTEKGIIGHAP